MLIWVCALRCEAKPLIDFYRLKKTVGKHPFDSYQNGQVSCIVSGIGLQNMAQAIDWYAGQVPPSVHPYWINLGIAGDKHLPIGSAVLASRVRQSGRDDWLDTDLPTTHGFTSKAVTSLHREQTDYTQDTLYDMEASAFFDRAKCYSALERCHSIKIISDNSDTPPDRNKARISQLIADNMPAIADFASQLINSR